MGRWVASARPAAFATLLPPTEAASCLESRSWQVLGLRGAQQRDQAQAAVRRITGELAGIAETAIREATAVIRNARRALRVATGCRRGRLHRAINDLDALIERTKSVVAQTRSRLAGVMPESASRLVSLHDVDGRHGVDTAVRGWGCVWAVSSAPRRRLS
jgi:transposase, IS5 family